MPTYGYVCDQCGHQFEVLQKISDAPLKECPACGSPLRKQLYPVGVVFKGSGFYTTDYKGGGKGSKGSGDGGSDSGAGDGKADSKGDSKSESKADSKPDAKPPAPAASSSE